MLATSDLPGLEWFTRLLDEAGPPLLPGLAQEPERPVEAALFKTSYDGLQAVERLLAAAPEDDIDIRLALVTFGWGDQMDPCDAAGAAAMARTLLASTPLHSATTCGSAAIIAGPMLSPDFGLLLTDDLVRGPVDFERVFRIAAQDGDASGRLAPCLEWTRRYAAVPLSSERFQKADPGEGRSRLTIAHSDSDTALEAEIARLALQAHARGDVVLCTAGRSAPSAGVTPGPGPAGIALLDLALGKSVLNLSADCPRAPDLGPAGGFACLDNLEAWLRELITERATTLVIPDVGALDQISRVVVERVLQDCSLPNFSLVTAQLGETIPEVLRQLMAKVNRSSIVQLRLN